MKAQITKIFRGKSRAAFEKSVIVLRFDRKFVSRYYFYKYIKKHVCLLLKLITRQTTSFFDRIKYQSFFKRRIGMEKNFVPGFITLPTLANVWVVGVIFPHSHCFKLCLKYTFSHSIIKSYTNVLHLTGVLMEHILEGSGFAWLSLW